MLVRARLDGQALQRAADLTVAIGQLALPEADATGIHGRTRIEGKPLAAGRAIVGVGRATVGAVGGVSKDKVR